tara:strand:- start:102 stop:260 length:159 start_codon:yes stop_codon:yes gene_type:complete
MNYRKLQRQIRQARNYLANGLPTKLRKEFRGNLRTLEYNLDRAKQETRELYA